MKANNVMRKIRIEKVTLNVGTGKEKSSLEKGKKLISHITGIKPIVTRTKKRIAAWGLRPGLPIGCKLTLRGKKAEDMLEKFMQAKEKMLSRSQFDEHGNFSFGVHEYIDIPNVKYDPELGLIGLEISVTLERPGFRIKRRRIQRKKIGSNHKISKEEAITFVKEKFKVRIKEELGA